MLVNHKIILAFVVMAIGIILVYVEYNPLYLILSLASVGSLFIITKDKLKLKIIFPISVALIVLGAGIYYLFIEKPICGDVDISLKNEDSKLKEIKSTIEKLEGEKPWYPTWDSRELKRLQIREGIIQDKLDELIKKKGVCAPNKT
jgi:hypothetical protein